MSFIKGFNCDTFILKWNIINVKEEGKKARAHETKVEMWCDDIIEHGTDEGKNLKSLWKFFCDKCLRIHIK